MVIHISIERLEGSVKILGLVSNCFMYLSLI